MKFSLVLPSKCSNGNFTMSNMIQLGGILILYVYCFKNEMKNKFLMRLIMDKKRVFGYLGLKFVVNFN